MNNDEWTGITAWLLRPVVRFLLIHRSGRGLAGLALITAGLIGIIGHHVIGFIGLGLGLFLLLLNGRSSYRAER